VHDRTRKKDKTFFEEARKITIWKARKLFSSMVGEEVLQPGILIEN
jgi:hypothetical protein